MDPIYKILENLDLASQEVTEAFNDDFTEDDLYEFEQAMHQVAENVRHALDLIPNTPEFRDIKARAQSYWYPQISGTVDGEASMHSMANTYHELENAIRNGTDSEYE